MEIEATKVVKVNAKTIKIHTKVTDRFNCGIYDQDGCKLKDHEGYVPHFMPGDHYGDYLILDIDLDSGQITNWRQLDAEKLQEFINGD